MQSSRNQKQTRVFGIVLILIEIAMGLIYGFFVDYIKAPSSDRYLIVILTMLLALLGFGMLLVYVKSASAISVAHTVLIFAFSLQLYFPIRGMWELVRISDSAYNTSIGASAQGVQPLLPINLINNSNDRQTSGQQLVQSSFLSWIQCYISLLVAYSSVVGRVGFLEVLFIVIFGTIGFELNEQLFWKYFITDCGGPMRIFLFGSSLGLTMAFILMQKQTVLDHERFKSKKSFQTFTFIAAIFISILLPVLNWADLFHTTGNDSYIIHIVSLNMWLSLCGSVIGAYCISLVSYKKLSIHDLSYSIFTGGIAYSAISDLYFNPGVAIGVGTMAGFVSTVSLNVKWAMNKKGVVDSTGVFSAFFVPGLLASILSAIFQANIPQDIGVYTSNAKEGQNRLESGGYQLAGAGFSIAIGIAAAILASIFIRILNQRQYSQQFENKEFIIFSNGEDERKQE